MDIGTIVSSTSHIEYFCQVYHPGDTPEPPAPADYGLGTFVGLEQAGGGLLVGVIANTALQNPEFGNLGPRISPQEELPVFAPDYMIEKATLVAVVILGSLDSEGVAMQSVPAIAPQIDTVVRTLEEEEIVRFHRSETSLRVAYLPMLASLPNLLMPHLTLSVLEQLQTLFPDEAQRLSLLSGNLAWKSRVEPVS